MEKYFSVFAFFVLFTCFTRVHMQEEKPCKTPSKQSGFCVNIYTCKSVTRLLVNNPSAKTKNFVKSLSCGTKSETPLVCCPHGPIRLNIQPMKIDEDDLDDKENINDSKLLLTPPVCGSTNATFPKVVGGVPAKLGEFPWMVALGYRNLKNSSQPMWLCGGSLISFRHVLTAAHCIYGRSDLYIARLGELDLYDDNDGANPVDFSIAAAKIHEDFNPRNKTNDIGILTLSKSADNLNGVWPICLPWESDKRSKTYLNTLPFVAGWGKLRFDGQSSSTLQLATIPVVNNSVCAKAYGALYEINERIICAGYPMGGIDACSGDSGGPLMSGLDNKNEKGIRFYLIGLISYGYRCAEPDSPGVYTRVTSFLRWIEKNLA